MRRRWLSIAVLWLAALPAMQAQEMLTGLPSNVVIQQKILKEKHTPGFKSSQPTPLLTLPFFDDFTTSRVFPDAHRWVEKALLSTIVFVTCRLISGLPHLMPLTRLETSIVQPLRPLLKQTGLPHSP